MSLVEKIHEDMVSGHEAAGGRSPIHSAHGKVSIEK